MKPTKFVLALSFLFVLFIITRRPDPRTINSVQGENNHVKRAINPIRTNCNNMSVEGQWEEKNLGFIKTKYFEKYYPLIKSYTLESYPTQLGIKYRKVDSEKVNKILRDFRSSKDNYTSTVEIVEIRRV